MPKRTTGLSDANARLHKNHSFELLVATWLMDAGWQVFSPLLDAAHAVDLIASDVRVGPGSELVEISVKKKTNSQLPTPNSSEFGYVELSHETERAFAWLRSQCPINPDLEKHLVGYAKLTGLK